MLLAATDSVDYFPLLLLAVGIATVLGLIIAARLNAFLALIIAALVVSLFSPGDLGARVQRVAEAFGSNTGKIGIIIALASIIGKCMLDSGAADRIVRTFTGALGEKRAPVALLGSGFVLAIPVFFDTVFYLLVPLARSLYRRTHKNYLKYLIAISAGGAITHTLVPPTPGPLFIAANLGIDPGMMIMMGLVVAIPPALVGLAFGTWIDKKMPIPMRAAAGDTGAAPLEDHQLPPFWLSILPVLLPVVLISANTLLEVYADMEPTTTLTRENVPSVAALRDAIAKQAAVDAPSPGRRIYEMLSPEAQELLAPEATLTAEQEDQLLAELNLLLRDRTYYTKEAFANVTLNPVAAQSVTKDLSRMQIGGRMRVNRALLESAYGEALIEPHVWDTPRRVAAGWGSMFGNSNLALLISTLIAIGTLAVSRKLSLTEVGMAVEDSLMSGGVIILITAAGGAFGDMLSVAKVGDSIQQIFANVGGTGIAMLLLGFIVAAIFKIAQGSTTVSMITTSGMLASLAVGDKLGFHPVYLATAIGCGGLFGSWMNDSGFWVYAKMGGLTEGEALKSWTVLLILMSLTGLAVTIALALALPLI